MASLVLWKWIEQTTTQFTRVSGSGMLSASATIFANGDENDLFSASALRMVQVDSSGSSIWLFDDPLPPKFQVQFSTHRQAGASQGTTGFVFGYQDNDHYFVIGMSGSSANTLQVKCQDGATLRKGARPTAGFVGQGSVTAPHLVSFTILMNTSSAAPKVIVYDFSALAFYGTEDVPAYFGSGANALTSPLWTGSVATRAGIMLNPWGVALSATMSGSLSEFTILKHPTDW